MRKKRRPVRKESRANRDGGSSPAQLSVGAALLNQGEDRRERLSKATEELRSEMERHGAIIRDLILTQPPRQLLGYLVAKLHMGFLNASYKKETEAKTQQKELIKTYQLAFEYIHAVWSSHSDLPDEGTAFDEQKSIALFDALAELERATMFYCMASTAANGTSNGVSSDTEFHAKSSWTLIRGNRYQVLEEEFLRFVLEPHRDALREAYGMDAQDIARGIQGISDAMRIGFSRAVEEIRATMERTADTQKESSKDLSAAIETLRASDGTFDSRIRGAVEDIFYGGICNLSRHTNLSASILDDLCYVPGGNSEFFADGPFVGTPMRTLPARIKPGILLGTDAYVADGQFIRDVAYRAIQRGLLARVPAYREEWNQRQKRLIETSFPAIFSSQLGEATVHSEVYFKDLVTGQWVETDLVMVFADTLFVVEAKAGVMTMHSPATNFERHERAIRELIVKAYLQCKRFLDYLASAPEVPIYTRLKSEFVVAGRLKLRDFRLILPIGLTVEAFTPFSTMCKELPEVQPLLARHPFVSMSVDDLFVLNRFLPTTAALLHYLEVRQQVAGIQRAMIFDEIDHLGAYISNNRFDISIREQLGKADFVTWDSFGDIVDKHFESENWRTQPTPQQEFPSELADVLAALDRMRRGSWLRTDAHIRNLGGEARRTLARNLRELRETLGQYPARRFLLGGDGSPLLVWLCRGGAEPSDDEMRHHAQVGCLTMNVPSINAMRLSFEGAAIVDVNCAFFSGPSVVQLDFQDLLQESEKERRRMKRL